MEDKYVTYRQNPKIDLLFGLYQIDPIPTKQDGYKPLRFFGIRLGNLFIRHMDKLSIKNAKDQVKSVALKAMEANGKTKIRKPKKAEVILSISMLGRRYKEVDVDNLSKTVLDGLTGVVFDDDSQVTNLIVNKHVHPMKTDAIFIGVTELTEERKGLSGDIFLFID